MKSLWHILKTLLFALCSILLCCKKETPVFPIISIEKPYENQIFAVYDTIFVAATISHDRPLTHVSAGIVNENMVLMTPRFDFKPDAATYKVNTFIIVNNIELSSGSYYLQIKASDGHNETNAYKKIYLHEAPRIFQKALLITKSGPHNINISKTEDGLQTTLLGQLTSDYGYAAYEPVAKNLYISGRHNSSLYCFNYEEQQLNWSLQVPGYPPAPYFNHIIVNRKRLYVALRHNTVMAFNEQGTIMLNLLTGNDFFPDKLLAHDNLLITAQKAVSGTNSYIIIYYIESGAFAQMLQINYNPIKMFAKDINAIYVFGNDLNNHAVLRIYQPDENAVWTPYSMPPERLYDVEKVNSNTFLLAFENSIKRYTYSPSGLVTFIDDIQARSLRYDDINQKLWVATKNNQVHTYTYPFAGLQTQINLTDSLKDILLVYNKP